jgi:DeoR/GlpR family transcriptional regulator of sugar metabolism
VNGISLEYGYTVNSRNQAALYKLLISNSNETVVVADYSKFGKRAFTQVSPIEKIKKVVTNVQLENRYKEYFFDNGIKLFTTFEEKTI